MNPEFDAAAWLAGLTDDQKNALLIQLEAARAAGFAAGSQKAERALRINRILIPLAVFGPFVGLLIQRYLLG